MERIDFNKDLRTKKVIVKQDLSSYEINTLVKTIGLTTEQFIPWHCKAVKQLGANKYTALADMAIKAKNPPMLMSWLLKQELSKH